MKNMQYQAELPSWDVIIRNAEKEEMIAPKP